MNLPKNFIVRFRGKVTKVEHGRRESEWEQRNLTRATRRREPYY